MGKQHTTLTIDGEVLQRAKALNLNISGEFQSFLEKYIYNFQGNLEGINLELLNIEIIRLQNELNKMAVELQSKLKLKEQIELALKEKEKLALEQEKKMIEEKKKCVICGFSRADTMKMRPFPVGSICNTCFMEKRDTKRWFKSNTTQ